MKALEKTYDAIARERDASRKQPREWLNFFLPFLKKNWVVIDAGCGNANNAIEIARRAKQVACIDFSKELLECARENVRAAKLERKIELIKADIVKMPFRNEEFDAAFYIAVLPHLRPDREQNAAFKEMNRVLKPGGLVFASVWNKTQQLFAEIKGKSALVPGAAWGGKRFKRYYYFFDEKEIRALAHSHGFHVRELFYEKKGVKTAREGAHNLCFILEKT